ncbi:MAG: hypothetical protein IJ783_11230, partial [Kiritimatiellae bacterium]|nr:hypothetical protein [Kiritimatiellia bacterium]
LAPLGGARLEAALPGETVPRRPASADNSRARRDRRRGRQSGAPVSALAAALVEEVVVEPFRTGGWRVPRLMCQDLCSVLDSLVAYPSRDLRRRSAFSLPWFHTALVFWEICAEAEGAGDSADALAQWRSQFDEWASGPRPERRGRYVPVDPDSAQGRGFPPENPGEAAAADTGDSPAADADAETSSDASDAADATAETGGEEAPSGDGAPARKRRRRRRGGRRERLRRERQARRAETEAGGSAAAADSPETGTQPQ